MTSDSWENAKGDSFRSRRKQFATEMKTQQSTKIREIKECLVRAGKCTLDEQADALGLSRSTTWAILKGGHKASGLSARTVNRILAKPQLSGLVRTKILEYIEEKVTGQYGHSEVPRHRFVAQLSVNRFKRADPNKSYGVGRSRKSSG
jgi:hypothetical protein